MLGLLGKIFYETRWQSLLFGLGLAIVMSLLTALLPKVMGDIDQLFSKLPFIKPLITALLGVDPGDQLTATMSQAFLWVHPTVLTLIWAHELMFCTRTPAGEIDRGTIDFLLSLPISRWRVFMAETIAWLASGFVVIGLGFAGHLVTSQFTQAEMRPPWMLTFYIMVNLLALYLAVGGVAFLASAMSDRRYRAIGVVFCLLLASFLLNFIAQFWNPFSDSNSVTSIAGPAQDHPFISWFSIVSYYRPAIIIRTGQFPMLDVGVLVTVAAICWSAAAAIFGRRNICTV